MHVVLGKGLWQTQSSYGIEIIEQMGSSSKGFYPKGSLWYLTRLHLNHITKKLKMKDP